MKYQKPLTTASIFASFSLIFPTFGFAQGSAFPVAAESSRSLAKVYDRLENHETRIDRLEVTRGSSATNLADARTVGKTIRQNVATTYTVKKGDSLNGIARKYNLSAQSLASANGMRDMNSLRVGQTLRIPGRVTEKVVVTKPTKENTRFSSSGSIKTSPGEHRVRQGDTLRSIAREHNASYGEIIRINNIKDPNRLPLGVLIKLPKAKSGTSAPSIADEHEERAFTFKGSDMGLPPDQLHSKDGKRIEKTEQPARTTRTKVVSYTLKEDDTFTKVAARMGTSVEAISRANPGVNPHKLRPGQKIAVPTQVETAEVVKTEKAPAIAKVSQKTNPSSLEDLEDENVEPVRLDSRPQERSAPTPIHTTTSDNYLSYPVAKEDTWASIAKEYETTEARLREINAADTWDNPVPGKHIMVPRDKFLSKRVSRDLY